MELSEFSEQTCNFCGRKDKNNIDSVDGYSEQLSKLRKEEIIVKHFWFKQEDVKCFLICTVCWDKLLMFHIFYCQVEELYKPQEAKIKLDPGHLSPDPEYSSYLVEFDNTPIKSEGDCKSLENASEVEDEIKDNNIGTDSNTVNEESEKQITVIVSNSDILLHCQMKCEVCSEEFESFRLLKRHYSKVHNQNGHVKCCALRFTDLKRLKEHIKVHINPKSFQCNECQKNFSSKRSLFQHQLVMHIPDEQKLFQCEQCSKKFAKQYQLNKHLIKHKQETQIHNEFTCHQCQKQLCSKVALRNHIRNIHEDSGEKHLCDICSKILKTKGALNVHLSEHFTTERSQCTICGKHMKNANTLRKHLALHREETIECHICGKKSPNSHALRKHIRDQHTNTRSYQCTMCEKAFKRAIVLKEHMATHTGQLLYSCVHCGKEFNSSANLCSHRKKVHPKEWNEYQQEKKISGVKTYSIVNN
ncbi:transcription factor grauzone-like [Sabethes cyaneus]|uniref:transcription factor grauzone-like n=1 Tax=Sabethes cyaneus TaxID=53552 RepID=UPI00237DFFAB|nr:transcription factor grauzone-like [Sabethes cyaneus]